MTVQINTGAGQDRQQDHQPEQTNLDRCYGKIGIPALAAALRYSTQAKLPAYTPAVARIDERFPKFAA